MVLEWKRANQEIELDNQQEINEDDLEERTDNDEIIDGFCTITKHILPQISAEKFPFVIDAKLPSFGWLGKEFAINYEIRNKLEAVLEMECTLEENENFGIAGKKLASLKIAEINNFEFILNLGIDANYAI